MTPSGTDEANDAHDPPTADRASRRRHRTVTLILLVVAFACYVAVVSLRQGPPPGGDTVPLVAVTTDLSTGQLGAAAAVGSLPDPPGYALWTSPFVALFRSSVGSPTWCTTPSRVAALREESAHRHDPNLAQEVLGCGLRLRFANGTTAPAAPPWYRSQGVLGVASWLVLAIGSLAVLAAARVDTVARQAGLLAFLVVLPAASSAIVQLFHPQDIVSLGLSLGAVAATLRSRWVLAGLLFGAALLTKQFALLLFLPALGAAPGTRARLHMAAAAAAIFVAGVLPFLVVSPGSTLDNAIGLSGGGAIPGMTLLSLAGVGGSLASAIARGAPVLFALLACLWAVRRVGTDLARPDKLVALTLACVGSRLVFESVVYPYYLLATSVVFVLLDLVAARSPHRSIAWCAAAAFFVAFRPANETVAAIGTLVLAALAVAAGLSELDGPRATPVRATALP